MIKCKIITPLGAIKEFETNILNVETIDGQRGILKNHTPLVTILNIGKLSFIENNEKKDYALSGGLLYFSDNKANILTDSFESKDEIDIHRAILSRDRAIKRIEEKNSDIDYERAKKSLHRALNRIKIRNLEL